jgi:hypothetical protein
MCPFVNLPLENSRAGGTGYYACSHENVQFFGLSVLKFPFSEATPLGSCRMSACRSGVTLCGIPGRLGVPRHIEWVDAGASLRFFQANDIESGKHLQHRLGPILVETNQAPSRDNDHGFLNGLEDVSIILRADRILDRVQAFWISRNQSEEVRHNKTVEFPTGAEGANPLC